MKRIILLLGIISVIAFCSCKKTKTRDCTCTWSSGSGGGSILGTTEECSSYNTTVGGDTYTCVED